MKGLLKRHKIYTLILIMALIVMNCQSFEKVSASESKIEIWYGLEQSFGRIGNAQRQINILGNIQFDNEKIRAYYILNGNNNKNYLTLGPDLHRLARRGDFNIEIERKDLRPGQNVVELFVESGNTLLQTQKISVFYYGDKKWPLPYHVHWNEVNRIQDVVEIVDGEWELTDSGIRTKYGYYDRIVAFGDSSWRNYEVETTVIFHDYTPPIQGPPTYNVSHVAIASRWPGHDIDNLQPNRKWYPLGATSEFRITENYENSRWRIFDREHFYAEQGKAFYRQLLPEITYRMKHRVEDLSKTRTLYSVKFWKADEKEPSEWDFQAIEISERKETGSACLIAHNTDVTFGDISVIPIRSKY